MPESVALSWRGGLGDDYTVNLPIVEDDGRKLPNCLTPSHPALQRTENIFKPIIHVVNLQRASAQIQLHLDRQLRLRPILHALIFRSLQRCVVNLLPPRIPRTHILRQPKL